MDFFIVLVLIALIIVVHDRLAGIENRLIDINKALKKED